MALVGNNQFVVVVVAGGDMKRMRDQRSRIAWGAEPEVTHSGGYGTGGPG